MIASVPRATLARTVAAALLAVLVPACGTTPARDDPAPGPGGGALLSPPASGSAPTALAPGPSASPSASKPTGGAAVAQEPAGLRGTRLSTGLSCRGALKVAVRQWLQDQAAIDDPESARGPDRPVPGTVDLIRIYPDPHEFGPSTQRDLRRGSQMYRIVATALALADTPRPPAVDGVEVLCSTEGDGGAVYVARAAGATFLLHIPVDFCGHHLDPVRAFEAQILV